MELERSAFLGASSRLRVLMDTDSGADRDSKGESCGCDKLSSGDSSPLNFLFLLLATPLRLIAIIVALIINNNNLNRRLRCPLLLLKNGR